MKRKVTLVFHDEELYTKLKIEAVKRRTTASDIVSDAVREWLESHEDAELIPVTESIRSEWEINGGRSWTEVEQELAEAVNRNEENPQAKRV